MLIGKITCGFWGFMTLAFVSFYNSNLRRHLIAPVLEPEINSDDDILKYNVPRILTDNPGEQKS